MTNPTPWKEEAWRKRTGFDNIAKLTWRTPEIREVKRGEKVEALLVYGLAVNPWA